MIVAIFYDGRCSVVFMSTNGLMLILKQKYQL